MNIKQSVIELFKSGKTLQDIGDLHGVSRQRIGQITKNAGLARKDGGASLRIKNPTRHNIVVNDLKYLIKYGMSHKEWRAFDKTIFRKFANHKLRAKFRGIEFKLTFEEWWKIWSDSGKFSEIGTKKNQYVMSRAYDTGAYEVGNVSIITTSQNMREWRKVLYG